MSKTIKIEIKPQKAPVGPSPGSTGVFQLLPASKAHNPVIGCVCIK